MRHLVFILIFFQGLFSDSSFDLVLAQVDNFPKYIILYF